MKSFSQSGGAITRWERARRAWRLYVPFAFLSLTAFPLLFSIYDYSPLQTFLAFLLINICIIPTVQYFAGDDRGLPALPILCWAFAIQFGVPFFTREAAFELAGKNKAYLDDAVIIYVLILCILGICAFQVGFSLVQSSRMKGVLPIAQLHLDKKKAIIFCIAVGLLLPLILSAQLLVPAESVLRFSSILNLLQNQAFVVIGILGWLVYTNRASKWLRVGLYLLVIIAVVRGFSSTMFEQVAAPILVLCVVKWTYTKRLPTFTLGAIVFLAIFLSPVKGEYRQKIWYEQPREQSLANTIPNALLWFDEAADYWEDALTGARPFTEATSALSSRTDFLHQFAHICSLTPTPIDYQYGGTYSFFMYALIPRIIWPDKPLAGSANNYYAVTYGVATEDSIQSSTFGVSLIGESYINFGVYGVIIIMFLQGSVIALLRHVFGNSHSGPGGQAVFLAFFIYFLNGMGSSAEIIFGGIFQNLVCGCVLLLWVREKSARVHAINLPIARSLAK